MLFVDWRKQKRFSCAIKNILFCQKMSTQYQYATLVPDDELDHDEPPVINSQYARLLSDQELEQQTDENEGESNQALDILKELVLDDNDNDDDDDDDDGLIGFFDIFVEKKFSLFFFFFFFFVIEIVPVFDFREANSKNDYNVGM